MDATHPLRRLIAAGAVAICAGCSAPAPVHYSSRSDDPVFFERHLSPRTTFPSEMEEIHAGIVSHHLFAAGYISRFFATIREAPGGERPRTFIILGPDHRRQCRAMVAATRRPWKTPFGTTLPDRSLTKRLRAAAAVDIDEDAFIGEHSIGALLPFIASYFPRSQVVPLLLNYRMSWEQAQNLGRILAAEADPGTILILSADFVHEKPGAVARRLDRRTAAVLARFRGEASINDITMAEIDCRKGLLALMTYLNVRKTEDMEILLNTDSAAMARRNVLTTSYFFVLYGNKVIDTQAP